MKPLKLVMHAFGPFAGCESVNFEKVGTHGIFLISGDTGAGKTTIFDAISFVLFGEASGGFRGIDSLRSGYADPNEKTLIELDFSHHGKRYHVERNPEYQRPKKRASRESQTTTEPKNAWMKMPDGDIIVGFKQVNEAVKELLGIDHNQFKQISMIAQGEFVQMLNTKSDQRGEILRKIFNTHLYFNLQKALSEKERELYAICQDDMKSIRQYLGGIKVGAESVRAGSAKEAVKNDESDILKGLLSEVLREDMHQLSEHKTKALQCETRLLEHNNLTTQAVLVNQQLDELVKDEKAYNQYKAEESAYQKKQIRVNAGKIAYYKIRPLEVKLEEAMEQHRAGQKEQDNTRQLIEQHELLLKGLEKENEQLQTQKPMLDTMQKRLQWLEAEIKVLREIEQLKLQLIPCTEKKQEKEKEQKKWVKKKENLQDEKIQLQLTVDSYEGIELKQGDLEKCCLEAEHLLGQVLEAKKKQDEIAVTSEQYEYGKAKFKEEEILYQTAKMHLNQAESSYYREQAGILADGLTVGEPCPVCGSVNHPNKALKTEGALTKTQLDQLKKETEQAGLAYQEIAQQVKVSGERMKLQNNAFAAVMANIFPEYSSDMHRWSRQLSEKKVELLQQIETKRLELKTCKRSIKLKSEHQKRIQEIHVLLDKIELQNRETEQEYRELERTEMEYLAGLTHLQGNVQFESKELAEKECLAIQIEFKNLSAQIEDIQRKLGTERECLSGYVGGFTSQKKRLNELEQDIIQKRERYLEEVTTQGMLSVNTYKESFIEETVIEKLESEIEEWHSKLVRLEETISRSKALLKDRKYADIAELKSQAIVMGEEKAAVEAAVIELSSRVTANKEISEAVAGREKLQKETREEYLKIKLLSDTLNGNLRGKNKVDVERYVQSYYFQMIVTEANKRFVTMSNGQFELRCREGAGDQRKSTGLDLEVMDYYTGKLQPVSSLSGGESFKAALSLALGMSDVVQNFNGGIEIDATFIDEGFGTLDSGSLEQAVQVLIQLTKGDKMVGIISHVEELKERIERKIIVHKSNRGSSIEER